MPDLKTQLLQRSRGQNADGTGGQIGLELHLDFLIGLHPFSINLFTGKPKLYQGIPLDSHHLVVGCADLGASTGISRMIRAVTPMVFSESMCTEPPPSSKIYVRSWQVTAGRESVGEDHAT